MDIVKKTHIEEILALPLNLLSIFPALVYALE